MKSFKRFLTPLFICLFGFLLLTGCGSSNNTPAQSQKDAVLAALNAARKSNNVNVLSEDDQADIIAARIANAGIDYYCGNLTKEQFEKEFYSAGMTKINGKYFSEIYTGTIIPTKSSDFYNKEMPLSLLRFPETESDRRGSPRRPCDRHSGLCHQLHAEHRRDADEPLFTAVWNR